MKHKRIVAVILLACIAIGFCCTGYAEAYDEDFLSFMQDFSVGKAVELISAVSEENYAERYMCSIDASVQEMIMQIDAGSPDYMFVLSSPKDMDLSAVFEEYALSDSLGAAFCFDAIYDANSAYIDKSFAEWADRSCMYDVTGNINHYPSVVYTVLVYSEHAPQIVTAFYREDDSAYITKTAFVYNTQLEPASIYAAFPYVALNIWGNLDSATIDLRNK